MNIGSLVAVMPDPAPQRWLLKPNQGFGNG